MRICVLLLVNRGGMVHYTSQLCNHLSKLKSGVEVYLIAPEGINEEIFDDNVNLKKIPSIGRHGYRIDLILKYVSEIKPDFIHITVIHPFIIPILPFLKKISPLAVTIHDVVLHSDQNNFIIYLTTYVFSKLADLNFVHGEKLKLELLKKGIQDSKIVSIPHGNYSFFKRIQNGEVYEQKNTILFFGRILEYKGIGFLIQAEPAISLKVPDLKIVIAGDGNFAPYEKMIFNKDKFEIINEYIPDKLVSELFQSASVVVLPYIEASQSGVVPIAYAFQKPVVVTDVGSLSECVIDGVTGLIIPPNNHELLADAIVKILTDDELKNNMGKAGYTFMESNMSWENVAHKTLVEYNKCAVGFHVSDFSHSKDVSLRKERSL
ncbi:glycosyltransferase family 4 protein [Methanosarcina mazei]|uniref:Glycosyltransferase family 4 protein n=2 Tax=Methanosarcina mazei TaxID=2209 RepID=A0A6C0VN36_METMZ|nr:glycosyltransferase family 4 protein [Methanosarcina mazei]